MPLILDPSRAIPGLQQLSSAQAARQEIRPLRIRLRDLDGTAGELQAALLAMLSDTPLQVEALVRDDGGPIDGVIAWSEQAEDSTDSSLSDGRPALLLGACARQDLAQRHGLIVERLTRPLHEVTPHRLLIHPLLTGQEPVVDIPVARTWRIGLEAVSRTPGLEVLAYAPRTGIHLAWEPAAHRLYALNQIAWSPLGFTRSRRRLAGAEGLHHADLPAHAWRAHAHLLVRSWLNLAVYQPLSLPLVLPY